jgi:hypothetical protein
MAALDFIVGLMVSLSFLAGSFIYRLSKEEVDGFVEKKARFLRYKTLPIAIAAILAVILSFSTNTAFLEVAAIGVFASGLIMGSFSKSPYRLISVLAFLGVYFPISFLY